MERVITTPEKMTEIQSSPTVPRHTNKFKTAAEAQEAYERAKNPIGSVEVLLRSSGVPKRFRGKSIKDVQLRDEGTVAAVKSVQGYLKTFSERMLFGSSGYFSGGCGTGKTMLACIIVEAICRQGYPAHYTTAWKMIQQIRRGYGKGESLGPYLREYIAKPLLVIDEVGVQKGTDDERVLLYQVIDGRYSDVKPTILISNSKDPVEDGYLDQRTIDRLKEGGGFSITFNGESYRR